MFGFENRYGEPRGINIRFIIGVILALVSIVGYFSSREYNPVTKETQFVSLSPKQEIALGLRATPQLIRQYGGMHPDQNGQAIVDKVGFRLVKQSDAAKTNWQYEFHLLGDTRTINAFALPGGQVFITAALYSRLKTEGQLAGVLGHEIGHVVARHGAERMAKSQLTQGLTGAVAVASGDASATQIAQVVGELVNMSYGRDDELESDRLGVRFMAQAGYDPRALIGVMEVLAQASGGNRQPEFFSTHPNPENRIEKIKAAIKEEFPGGVPSNLIP
jgi:predicted Zn-dependent protease